MADAQGDMPWYTGSIPVLTTKKIKLWKQFV